MIIMIQHTAMASMNQRVREVNPSHAKKMYALPNNPIKSRSPGVVGIGRKPRRSMDGDTVCHMVMATSIRKMAIKKIAVGKVHSIHARVSVIVVPPYTRPRANPFAIWLRTNQITIAPGTIVSIPAAASRP